MAKISNCKSCGKIFSYNAGRVLCPYCKNREEDEFEQVKNYLYQNPGATVTEISMELDVSVKRIKYYLREGRLEIIGGEEGNLVLDCEKCGKAIKSGRLCDECQKGLTSSIKKEANKLKEDLNKMGNYKNQGMRYLHKGDRKHKRWDDS